MRNVRSADVRETEANVPIGRCNAVHVGRLMIQVHPTPLRNSTKARGQELARVRRGWLVARRLGDVRIAAGAREPSARALHTPLPSQEEASTPEKREEGMHKRLAAHLLILDAKDA